MSQIHALDSQIKHLGGEGHKVVDDASCMKLREVHEACALNISDTWFLPILFRKVLTGIEVNNVHSDEWMHHVVIKDKGAALVNFDFNTLSALAVQLILLLEFEKGLCRLNLRARRWSLAEAAEHRLADSI